MKLSFLVTALAMCVWVSLVGGPSAAAILYSQDFDGPGSPGVTIASSSGTESGSVVNGGVGGSKAFQVEFDFTNHNSVPLVIVAMNTIAVPASDAAPLGAGSVQNPAQIRFSMDLKVQGSLVPNPITIGVLQTDAGYEQKHGIDANGDGDMTDSAMNFESVLRPTLIDGAGFVHVQFTLDEGAIRSSIFSNNPCCSNQPLTPIFDPGVTLGWRLIFGHEIFPGDPGFGLDAGNRVIVDNVVIETIPEPSTLALLIIGCAAIGFRRRAER